MTGVSMKNKNQICILDTGAHLTGSVFILTNIYQD
jgi:hypothetical protein